MTTPSNSHNTTSEPLPPSTSNLTPIKPQTLYLSLYNVVQLYLWAQVVLQTLLVVLITLIRRESPNLLHLYRAALPHAHFAQTLAWLEPVHAVIGLAGSGFAAAFTQSLGRYVILVFVVEPIPAVHNSPITLAMLTAWALADVVRYTFYLVSAAAIPPRTLVYLRYTLFLPLYPVGIISEWLLYFTTLRHIDQAHLHSIRLPNTWNFAFNFGLWNRLVLILYIYFGPFMYSHMLRQRKRKLS